MRIKENKGVTLIALAVTIIVMLILAGVTISTLTGNSGITTKAQNAKKMSKVSSEKEAIQLAVSLAKMEKYLDENNEYYIGTPLYDKTLENGDKWDVIIIKDTLEQYGTNWCYVAKGTEIAQYGETQYEWLVNYETGEVKQLEEEYTELSYKSSLAITDGLVLNIDATNLEDENWGDIIKHGDVKYSSAKKSLYFDGDGDYLELAKSSDFSNGFTFEIYANLERLEYNNGSNKPYSLGLFCKMPTLQSSFTDSMRFGLAGSDESVICKFYGASTWSGTGDNISTANWGAITSLKKIYNQNENFYLTFVYKRYNEQNPQWKERADKVECYIDGQLYGYTYYGIDSYNQGAQTWNTNSSHFYLGVCPWWANGNLYYLKGDVYCTRLYEKALSSDEVKLNVETTQLYRQTLQ